MADFEAIYRTHASAVFRYALRTVGNRPLAEDITSEAFLELYRNLHSIDEGRLPAWLFTVVKNRAVDHWRKHAVEQRYAQETRPPEAAPAAGMDVEAWLLREPALKPIHRVCLVLHFVHGMTRAEIGQRLNISEIRVKGHLQYALQLLRKAWDSAKQGGLHGLEAEARPSGAGALK
ncbi:MAG TPA: sigma-70 family RNA polymerase sigma factor [Candidatus Angelobacter sp.]|nr:sigma-70 family RNA polymerase sigma factor [Candidatus Angelobacter sp.]